MKYNVSDATLASIYNPRFDASASASSDVDRLSFSVSMVLIGPWNHLRAETTHESDANRNTPMTMTTA